MNSNVLSWRGTQKHFSLETNIRAVDLNNNTSRGSITTNAIDMAYDKNVNWLAVQIELAKTPTQGSTPPSISMQAVLKAETEQKFLQLRQEIIRATGTQRPQTGYIVQLLWCNYYICLKKALEKRANSGSDKKSAKDFTRAELLTCLAEILIENEEESVIAQIRNILIQREQAQNRYGTNDNADPTEGLAKKGD